MNILAQSKSYVHVPETVSPEAQEFLRTLQDPRLIPAFPAAEDTEAWLKIQAWAEADGKVKAELLLKQLGPKVTRLTLGGVPVLDVQPSGWKDNGKALIYVHGGAHVMYSAESTLGRAAIAAHSSGLRVFSIDYTLAPHAQYEQMSDQVVAAIQGLLERGQKLDDLGVYGDSSGGGLIAASVLKMRDRGLGMPKAVVLVSPWLDVTPCGDTETTLLAADPNSLYELHGKQAAAAFAPVEEQKSPYASPVYGDYAKGFPPTLIQGGLKEVLLSGFVRLYQAIDVTGQEVKLDLYEGMPHNFQDRIPDAPESALARKKMREFLQKHLGC